VPSDYRLSQPVVVRMMGALLVLLGVVVLLMTLGVGVLGVPTVVLSVGIVLVALLLLAAALVLTRGVTLVRLDDAGYRVRLVRGAGVQQARWTDVEDVVATTVVGERCVVLRLRDGRTTTIPMRLLRTSPEAFVKDLQGHLNRGHGYRRIN
jgi:hypothetical protein